MTGNDVIAAVPWIYFGVMVAAVCIRLLGLRRTSSRGRTGPRQPRPAATAVGPAG